MKNLFIILTALIFITSCELLFDPEPELPPVTEEGNGTFGCKINGEVWLPDDRYLNSGGNILEAFLNRGIDMHIKALYEPKSQSLEFTLRDIFNQDKSIQFYQQETEKSFASVSMEDNCNLKTDSNSGYLEILKIDSINKIVAGTFEFIVFSDCDTVEVTEGRFDLNYYE
ncbi:hypothetical protein [Marivirga arenosa]|uniref:Lipoprotein n=1 Tax=Marivirga arenosa TaxID=3059076 RepID=A0AA51ZSH6_9BACT|nr:hypothetical protein [Marivirga sp. BKB1-2]WNB17140.1 hypothetical protein QYS47_33035 [Marivirga sp. BKB1-2]